MMYLINNITRIKLIKQKPFFQQGDCSNQGSKPMTELINLYNPLCSFTPENKRQEEQ